MEEMEILFSQKLEHFTIDTYKNYSSINDKDLPPDLLKKNRHKILIDPPRKRKGKYFYVDKDIIERLRTKEVVVPKPKVDETNSIFDFPDDRYFNQEPYYSNDSYEVQLKKLLKSPFETTSEKHLKRHFGNPFTSISVSKNERSIVRRGDKITLKIFNSHKRRELNWKFFKKTKSLKSITINMTTGNFTIVINENTEKKKFKLFRRNNFQKIIAFVNESAGIFDLKYHGHSSDTKKSYEEIFKNDIFLLEVYKALGIKPKTYDNESFTSELIDFFIGKRKIKVPNIYNHLFTYYYPTEKVLKKNDRKLIASILDRFGIKSKLTIKLLHQYPYLDLLVLRRLCGVFGDDYHKYISNIDIGSFVELEKSLYKSDSGRRVDYNMVSKIYNELHDREDPIELSDIQKGNVISIMNTLVSNSGLRTSIGGFLGLLHDHIIMLKKIRYYYPEKTFNSRTYDTFMTEHNEFSRISRLLKKPTLTNLIYDEEAIKVIEKDILIDKLEESDHFLQPFLLKTEEDYMEEGEFMHHCVSGYINYQNSVIVSLRSPENGDRVTIEFDGRNGEHRQSRYIQNKNYPSVFEGPIKKLKQRMKILGKQHKLKYLKKEEVKVYINGIPVGQPEPSNTPGLVRQDPLELYHEVGDIDELF